MIEQQPHECPNGHKWSVKMKREGVNLLYLTELDCFCPECKLLAIEDGESKKGKAKP